MAESKRRPETALNKILVVTKDMIVEYNRKVEAAQNSDVIATPEPIDCEALLELIEAAKKVYTENCPGP